MAYWIIPSVVQSKITPCRNIICHICSLLEALQAWKIRILIALAPQEEVINHICLEVVLEAVSFFTDSILVICELWSKLSGTSVSKTAYCQCQPLGITLNYSWIVMMVWSFGQDQAKSMESSWIQGSFLSGWIHPWHFFVEWESFYRL